MSEIKRWRDSDHLERAVESAGGAAAFDAAAGAMLAEARGWRALRSTRSCGTPPSLNAIARPAAGCPGPWSPGCGGARWQTSTRSGSRCAGGSNARPGSHRTRAARPGHR